MSWRTEWKVLSDRIYGLREAATFLLSTIPQVASDLAGVSDSFLIQNAQQIIVRLKVYQSTHTGSLPSAANLALLRFLEQIDKLITESPPVGLEGVQYLITALVAFQAEFSYLTTDRDLLNRRLIERAFIHLQRLIIADPDVTSKWGTAFASGETACERIGGAHLLSHGIWGFKANTEGGRTDLILGEPLQITAQLELVAETMVLTEWKIVRDPKDAGDQWEQAFVQAKLYTSSYLAGFEIASLKYLVLVSRDRLTVPADRIDNDNTYRHINIAVAPSTPSKTGTV